MICGRTQDEQSHADEKGNEEQEVTYGVRKKSQTEGLKLRWMTAERTHEESLNKPRNMDSDAGWANGHISEEDGAYNCL
jgi:hypothetical protein